MPQQPNQPAAPAQQGALVASQAGVPPQGWTANAQGWVATPQGWVPAPPDNKMVWSILVMVFAFLPFGIVAVMKSSEVNTKWAMGDYAGARRSADDAGTWIKYSLIAGAVIFGLVMLAFEAYLIIMVGVFFILSSASGIYH